MGRMSTAKMVVVESFGRERAQTWVHPPGAAQRSMMVRAFVRMLNLRLIWVSLKAARER